MKDFHSDIRDEIETVTNRMWIPNLVNCVTFIILSVSSVVHNNKFLLFITIPVFFVSLLLLIYSIKEKK